MIYYKNNLRIFKKMNNKNKRIKLKQMSKLSYNKIKEERRNRREKRIFNYKIIQLIKHRNDIAVERIERIEKIKKIKKFRPKNVKKIFFSIFGCKLLNGDDMVKYGPIQIILSFLNEKDLFWKISSLNKKFARAVYYYIFKNMKSRFKMNKFIRGIYNQFHKLVEKNNLTFLVSNKFLESCFYTLKRRTSGISKILQNTIIHLFELCLLNGCYDTALMIYSEISKNKSSYYMKNLTIQRLDFLDYFYSEFLNNHWIYHAICSYFNNRYLTTISTKFSKILFVMYKEYKEFSRNINNHSNNHSNNRSNNIQTGGHLFINTLKNLLNSSLNTKEVVKRTFILMKFIEQEKLQVYLNPTTELNIHFVFSKERITHYIEHVSKNKKIDKYYILNSLVNLDNVNEYFKQSKFNNYTIDKKKIMLEYLIIRFLKKNSPLFFDKLTKLRRENLLEKVLMKEKNKLVEYFLRTFSFSTTKMIKLIKKAIRKWKRTGFNLLMGHFKNMNKVNIGEENIQSLFEYSKKFGSSYYCRGVLLVFGRVFGRMNRLNFFKVVENYECCPKAILDMIKITKFKKEGKILENIIKNTIQFIKNTETKKKIIGFILTHYRNNINVNMDNNLIFRYALKIKDKPLVNKVIGSKSKSKNVVGLFF